MNRRLALAGAGWLVAVLALGLPLALFRHFQVDELQNVFDSRLIGLGAGVELPHNVKPWNVVAGWILAGFDRSIPMLQTFRTLFFEVFLLNLGLIAWGATSLKGHAGRLGALVAATCCWTLWRYGFEIRQDNFLLTGQLVLFGVTQRLLVGALRPRPALFAAVGAVGALIFFNALKGPVYSGPYLVLLLLAAHDGSGRGAVRSRVAPALWMAAGFAAATAVCAGLLASAGLLDRYLSWLSSLTSQADRSWTFTAHARLLRLSAWYALPAALALVGAAFALADVVRGRGRRLTPAMVCTAYVALPLFALLVLNPTPFPYNDVHLMPFVLLAAFEGAARLQIPAGRARDLAAIAALLALAIPFAVFRGTDHYGIKRSDIQVSYIEAAELLTPVDVPVVDGVGLVASRPAPGEHWMLHSALRPKYKARKRDQMRGYIREHWPPVVITGYRWRWAQPADRKLVSQHYVSPGRSFNVLGGKLRGRSGAFEVKRAGRYHFGAAVTIDGQKVAAGKATHLSVGRHRFVRPGKRRFKAADRVVRWQWVGALHAPPDLIALPKKGRLFLNARQGG